MALLEFLARAAPAGVVAADPLVLVHVPCLHVWEQLGRVLIRVFHALGGDAPGRGGGRERARLVGGGAARVGEVSSGACVARRAPGLRLLLLARPPAVSPLALPPPTGSVT